MILTSKITKLICDMEYIIGKNVITQTLMMDIHAKKGVIIAILYTFLIMMSQKSQQNIMVKLPVPPLMAS